MTVKREKVYDVAILIMVSVNHMPNSSDTSGDSPQLADSRHQKKRMWRPPPTMIRYVHLAHQPLSRFTPIVS